MSTKYFSADIQKFLAESTANPSAPIVLCLNGPLGAGKTTFTKELLAHYGFNESEVQSPTFLKLLEYQVPGLGLSLHLDCYRIDESDDFEDLALETYTEAALWVVEWPEKFVEFMRARESLRKVIGFKSYWDFDFSGGKKMDPILGSGGMGEVRAIQDLEGGLRWSRKLF